MTVIEIAKQLLDAETRLVQLEAQVQQARFTRDTLRAALRAAIAKEEKNDNLPADRS